MHFILDGTKMSRQSTSGVYIYICFLFIHWDHPHSQLFLFFVIAERSSLTFLILWAKWNVHACVDLYAIPWASISNCAHINLNMLSIQCRLFPDTHGCCSFSPSGFPTGRGVTMETDIMSARWHCWLLKDEVSLSSEHTVCVYVVFLGLRLRVSLSLYICLCLCVWERLVNAQWRSNEQLFVQTLVWWNELGKIPAVKKGNQPNRCLFYVCTFGLLCRCTLKCHETIFC